MQAVDLLGYGKIQAVGLDSRWLWGKAGYGSCSRVNEMQTVGLMG
jgi:hypothetical protein